MKTQPPRIQLASTATPPTTGKVLAADRRWKTRAEVYAKVQAGLRLHTKKEAEHIVDVVVWALEQTLTEHLNDNGFYIKMGTLGKFSVRHRPGTYRKIPLTGETKMTKTKRKVKFVALGRLRQLERVESSS